jgi:hypothetical protein
VASSGDPCETVSQFNYRLARKYKQKANTQSQQAHIIGMVENCTTMCDLPPPPFFGSLNRSIFWFLDWRCRISFRNGFMFLGSDPPNAFLLRHHEWWAHAINAPQPVMQVINIGFAMHAFPFVNGSIVLLYMAINRRIPSTSGLQFRATCWMTIRAKLLWGAWPPA